MKKEQWIEEVYQWLCNLSGEPTNDNQVKNIRAWAESLAHEDTGYFQEGMTPEDTVREELSYADAP